MQLLMSKKLVNDRPGTNVFLLILIPTIDMQLLIFTYFNHSLRVDVRIKLKELLLYGFDRTQTMSTLRAPIISRGKDTRKCKHTLKFVQ